MPPSFGGQGIFELSALSLNERLKLSSLPQALDNKTTSVPVGLTNLKSKSPT